MMGAPARFVTKLIEVRHLHDIPDKNNLQNLDMAKRQRGTCLSVYSKSRTAFWLSALKVDRYWAFQRGWSSSSRREVLFDFIH
jgi:hypothetical protein